MGDAYWEFGGNHAVEIPILYSLCSAIEKPTCPFLDIGVAMTVGIAHECDHLIEVQVGGVGSRLVQEIEEQLDQLKIQGVFTSVQELVVMDTSLAPVPGLIMQDIRLGIDRLVSRAVKDAVGMTVQWRDEVPQFAIVVLQGLPVVVPVRGHGQGITQEEPPKGPGCAFGWIELVGQGATPLKSFFSQPDQYSFVF